MSAWHYPILALLAATLPLAILGKFEFEPASLNRLAGFSTRPRFCSLPAGYSLFSGPICETDQKFSNRAQRVFVQVH